MAKNIDDYKKDYEAARKAGDVEGMRAANDSANQIRNQMGQAAQYADKDISYIKGLTGYNKPSGGGGGYSAPSAPSYSSKYGGQIDELLEEIMGRDPFSYDPESDPTYQQYKDSYTRQGQRAMTDTLGQVSARTGGLASSYATTASQQSYNNYMGALADKIPELKQLAYSMYMDEGNQKRGDLNLLMALEQGDYGKYQDLLGQYNQDRSFQYGVSRDQVGDQRYDREWGYQVGRDALGDQRYDQEWEYKAGRDQVADQRYEDERDYQREQDGLRWAYQKDADAYDRALTNWKLTGTLDEQGAKALGLPAGTKTTDYQYQLAQTAKMATSGGGGKKAAGETETYPEYADLYDQGIEGEGDAYLYYVAKGYNSSQAKAMAGYYKEWLETHKPIRDVSGLGGTAMAIANQMSRVDSDQSPEHFADTIEKALTGGEITEAEADFLLRAMGFN